MKLFLGSLELSCLHFAVGFSFYNIFGQIKFIHVLRILTSDESKIYPKPFSLQT